MNLQSTTIKQLYQKHSYNLYFTAQELEFTFPDRKTARADCSWEKDPPNDVPLLQECAFIKHMKKIREHSNKLREEEAKEFKKLKVAFKIDTEYLISNENLICLFV